jgi:hypothetical protein
MDLDTIIAEADPARRISPDGPDAAQAERLYRQITAGRPGRSWPRRQLRGRPKRAIHIAIPAIAAAMVVLIVVGAAVLVPHAQSSHRSATSRTGAGAARSAYPRYFVAVDSQGSSLSVHSATTGAQVAVIMPLHGQFWGLATGNGRVYYAAEQTVAVPGQAAAGQQGSGGTSRLYQFRLTAGGQPTALTLLSTGISSLSQPWTMAVSANGQILAYIGTSTSGATYLAVTNTVTGQTRRWQYPAGEDIGPLSLSADGSLLAYDVELTSSYPSVAGVLPTDAPPGSLSQRSRIVVRAASINPSEDIRSVALSPDGRTLYFAANATGLALIKTMTCELRVVGLVSGHRAPARVLRTFPGVAMGAWLDPSGRYMLLQTVPPKAVTPQLTRLGLPAMKVTELQSAWMPSNWSVPIAW